MKIENKKKIIKLKMAEYCIFQDKFEPYIYLNKPLNKNKDRIIEHGAQIPSNFVIIKNLINFCDEGYLNKLKLLSLKELRESLKYCMFSKYDILFNFIAKELCKSNFTNREIFYYDLDYLFHELTDDPPIIQLAIFNASLKISKKLDMDLILEFKDDEDLYFVSEEWELGGDEIPYERRCIYWEFLGLKIEELFYIQIEQFNSKFANYILENYNLNYKAIIFDRETERDVPLINCFSSFIYGPYSNIKNQMDFGNYTDPKSEDPKSEDPKSEDPKSEDKKLTLKMLATFLKYVDKYDDLIEAVVLTANLKMLKFFVSHGFDVNKPLFIMMEDDEGVYRGVRFENVLEYTKSIGNDGISKKKLIKYLKNG